MSKWRTGLGLGTGWVTNTRTTECVPTVAVSSSSSIQIPPSTEFLSGSLNWIGPVIPPLDIGRFSVC